MRLTKKKPLKGKDFIKQISKDYKVKIKLEDIEPGNSLHIELSKSATVKRRKIQPRTSKDQFVTYLSKNNDTYSFRTIFFEKQEFDLNKNEFSILGINKYDKPLDEKPTKTPKVVVIKSKVLKKTKKVTSHLDSEKKISLDNIEQLTIPTFNEELIIGDILSIAVYNNGKKTIHRVKFTSYEGSLFIFQKQNGEYLSLQSTKFYAMKRKPFNEYNRTEYIKMHYKNTGQDYNNYLECKKNTESINCTDRSLYFKLLQLKNHRIAKYKKQDKNYTYQKYKTLILAPTTIDGIKHNMPS